MEAFGYFMLVVWVAGSFGVMRSIAVCSRENLWPTFLLVAFWPLVIVMGGMLESVIDFGDDSEI